MNKEKIAEIKEKMSLAKMALKDGTFKTSYGIGLMSLGNAQRKFGEELTEEEVEILQIQQSIDNLRDELVNKISEK